jgi:hypothetical protein
MADAISIAGLNVVKQNFARVCANMQRELESIDRQISRLSGMADKDGNISRLIRSLRQQRNALQNEISAVKQDIRDIGDLIDAATRELNISR